MNSRLRHPRRSRAAFTIIEVMIAVAIMSMMLVAILQVLSAVRLTRDRIHNTQETQMAGPIIMDLITQDLEGRLEPQFVDTLSDALMGPVIATQTAITNWYPSMHDPFLSAIRLNWIEMALAGVPTADGVREPQNRRVEITYGPGSGM